MDPMSGINAVWYLAILSLAGSAGAGDVLAPATATPTDRLRRVSGLAVGLALLLLVINGVRLWSTTAAAFDEGQGVTLLDARVLLTDTRWGAGWVWQAGGALLSLAMALLWRRDVRLWPAFALAVLGTGLTTAFTGHAVAMDTIAWTVVLSHGLHVVAAGAWLGTLAVVLWATRTLSVDHVDDRLTFAHAIDRFSPLAMACVSLLLLAGLYAATEHVGSFANLATPYGQWFLVKTGAFAAAGLCGLWNARVLRPHIATSTQAAVRLRRVALLEVFCGVSAVVAQVVLATQEMPGLH